MSIAEIARDDQKPRDSDNRALNGSFALQPELRERILDKLVSLYGRPRAKECFNQILEILEDFYTHKTTKELEAERSVEPSERFTEKDVVLIAYGDQMNGTYGPPLRTLLRLCRKYLKGVFNTIHILPFFPYSSDRGFSVIDFKKVDSKLGSWDDIRAIKSHFKLMVDAVFNHVSSKHAWFQEFLKQNPEYTGFFISSSIQNRIPPEQLRLITRPRTSPLETLVKTKNGPRLVWTTFGPDQIDLNYKNPQVLVRMIDILLFYVRMGADIIRLDAVTYLWYELGTSCTHLAQTHTVIKLFRDILDAVAPNVAIITETNTPHKFNIQYFGNGSDEAQMVYNFALPPLVLYTFMTQDSTKLTNWAKELEKISDTATYFNFLDSHDGIGLRGVKNLLSQDDKDMMVAKVLEHGGHVSYRDNGDGTVAPYELNITWHCAITSPKSNEPEEVKIGRYLASRSIALVMMGVPGIYIHGLLGSMNDPEAVLTESEKRNINRSFLERERFVNIQEEDFPIAYKFVDMIRKRVNERLFHPNAPQRIIDAGNRLFTLLRSSVDNSEHLLTVTNVTDSPQKFSYNLNPTDHKHEYWYDILTGRFLEAHKGLMSLTLEPYQVLWFKSIS